MSSIAFLATVVAVMPLVGLMSVVWFAIMNEAATVHSFDGFDGMHFEEEPSFTFPNHAPSKD